MRTAFLIIRILIYAVLVFFLWRFVALQAMHFDARFKFMLPAWTMVLGAPILAAGIILLAVCLFEFVFTGKGTFAHFDPPIKFVATGVYKYSRNPMYFGVLLIFAGYALMYHSVSVLFLSLLLFVLAHLVVVFIEEPSLRNKFGDDYVNYTRSVGRWFPKFRK